MVLEASIRGERILEATGGSRMCNRGTGEDWSGGQHRCLQGQSWNFAGLPSSFSLFPASFSFVLRQRVAV